MDDRSLNETSPLSNLSDQLRAVEALLCASSDPLDEKTLTKILPENADIEKILEKIQELYKGLRRQKEGPQRLVIDHLNYSEDLSQLNFDHP